MRSLQYTDTIPKTFYIPGTLEYKEYDTFFRFNYLTSIDDGLIQISADTGSQYIEGETQEVLTVGIDILPNNSSLGYADYGEAQSMRYIVRDGVYCFYDRTQHWKYPQDVATFQSIDNEEFLITLTNEYYEVHKNDQLSSEPFDTNLLFTDEDIPEPDTDPPTEPDTDPLTEPDTEPVSGTVTIEENHELLDIILGYRPDRYTPKFTTVTFTNITGVPINFSLISPSGVEYTEIKEYRISEEGTWSWSAWAEGYESTSQSFNINKADYGRYISIEINLVQLVGEVLITGDCYLDIYSQLVPYMDIAQYKYNNNNYQYLRDHNVYNGEYQYYDEYDSYYLNTYEYPGYMTLHYYYKTGNSNLVELNHVPLIKSEYEGDTTGSMEIDLIDELTGNPPRGRIYYKMIGNFGMQHNVESDFADSVDYDGSYNETSNIHINNILAGYYTVMIWGDYYKKSFVNMVSSRDNQHSASVYLTPAYSASALRAILSWGSSPQDLDSHLKIYNSENTQLAHVSYMDKEYHKDNVLMAKLDVDEQEGYGPETTSVYQLESGNMYYFYVYNFSANMRIPTDARVDIKDSDTLVTSVSPPDYISDGSDGYYWKVFKYSADTQIIEIKNEVVGYEPDIYNWDN